MTLQTGTPQLGLLHTADVHIARFAGLQAKVCPDVKLIQHSVPQLLTHARETGLDSAELADAIRAACAALVSDGAQVVLCTCSTIAELAEACSALLDIPVLRVDRPMAAEAASLGQQRAAQVVDSRPVRVAMLASVASTLKPSRELLEAEAQRIGIDLHVHSKLMPDAWEAGLNGEIELLRSIVDANLRDLVRQRGTDVAVLAQVSLADAQPATGDYQGLPVLSSPQSGLRAAAVLCRTVAARV
jgi:Asp/Glu/hydantoin racemase